MLLIALASVLAAGSIDLDTTRAVPLDGTRLELRAFGDSAQAWRAMDREMRGIEWSPPTAVRKPHLGSWGPPVAMRADLIAPRQGRWWFVSHLRTPSHWRLRLAGRDLGEHGDFLPFGRRPSPTTDLAIPLDLTQGRQSLEVLAWEPQGPLALQVELVPDRAFASMVQAKARIDAAILGYLVAILLTAVYLWNAVRERAFGWYSAYLACALAWFSAKRGIGFEWIWPDHPAWNPGASIGVAHLAVGAFALFLCDLLNLDRRFPGPVRILRGLAYLQFAASPLLFTCALGPYPAARATLEWLQIAMPSTLLVLLVLEASAGNRLSRAILLSFLPLGVGMVYGALVEFSVAGDPAGKTRVMTIAALLENTLSTWVLLGEIRRRETSRLELERDFHRRLVDRTEELAGELARDLHDDVGQRAWALGMELRALRGRVDADLSEHLERSVGDLHRDVRDLSRRVHPPRLRSGGLPEALENLCADLSTPDTEIAFVNWERPTPLTELQATHLFRVAQEAVANAVRHGKAATVRVSLDTSGGRISLRIEDDGIGFVPGSASAGVGLSSMESRAGALGGRISIRSAPDRGCAVEVSIACGPAKREGSPGI